MLIEDRAPPGPANAEGTQRRRQSDVAARREWVGLAWMEAVDANLEMAVARVERRRALAVGLRETQPRVARERPVRGLLAVESEHRLADVQAVGPRREARFGELHRSVARGTSARCRVPVQRDLGLG